MTKTALITGVAGQDGSYLAELLLAKGYTVHGLVRGSSSYNLGRISHLNHDYREAYGLYVVNGIAFNHESPRRDESFVTRKIAMGAAAIAAGRQDFLYLGNLDAERDWGYAKEYVEGMWAMLQADEPDDFVLATGTSSTVRDFLDFCFAAVGLDWEKHVKFNDRYLRPAEVDALVGDASKAARELAWRAHVTTPDLARLMTEAEVAALAGPV